MIGPAALAEFGHDLRAFRLELAARMLLCTDPAKEADLCRMMAGILAQEERLASIRRKAA